MITNDQASWGLAIFFVDEFSIKDLNRKIAVFLTPF